MNKPIFLLLFLFSIFINCGRKQTAGEGEKVVEALPVKVQPAEQRVIGETIKTAGEIVPFYMVDMYSKVNGIVTTKKAASGENVKKGEVLAEVIQDIPGMEFTPVKIVSTAEGVITRDMIETGSRVSVQQPVFTVSRINQVFMETKVPESLLGTIKKGGTVSVETDAYQGRKFTGRIDEISPVIEPVTRTAVLKVLLNNSSLLLKPGMFARAMIKTGEHSALLVPLDAVIKSGASRYVFLVKENKAVQINVTTGIILDDKIEVAGALEEGDPVVVFGQNLLEDDVAVRVVEEY